MPQSRCWIDDVTPTVCRAGPFRFYFFSREESRVHIHVVSAQGEAKFWIEPKIELARNYGLSDSDGLNRDWNREPPVNVARPPPGVF